MTKTPHGGAWRDAKEMGYGLWRIVSHDAYEGILVQFRGVRYVGEVLLEDDWACVIKSNKRNVKLFTPFTVTI